MQKAFIDLNIRNSFVELPIDYLKGRQYKDINEWYCNTQRETFCEELEQSTYNKYTKKSLDYYLNDYMNEIIQYHNYPIKKTGFNFLDKQLDGGIRQGLYVIGAIPSLRQNNLYFTGCGQYRKE